MDRIHNSVVNPVINKEYVINDKVYVYTTEGFRLRDIEDLDALQNSVKNIEKGVEALNGAVSGIRDNTGELIEISNNIDVKLDKLGEIKEILLNLPDQGSPEEVIANLESIINLINTSIINLESLKTSIDSGNTSLSEALIKLNESNTKLETLNTSIESLKTVLDSIDTDTTNISNTLDGVLNISNAISSDLKTLVQQNKSESDETQLLLAKDKSVVSAIICSEGKTLSLTKHFDNDNNLLATKFWDKNTEIPEPSVWKYGSCIEPPKKCKPYHKVVKGAILTLENPESISWSVAKGGALITIGGGDAVKYPVFDIVGASYNAPDTYSVNSINGVTLVNWTCGNIKEEFFISVDYLASDTDITSESTLSNIAYSGEDVLEFDTVLNKTNFFLGVPNNMSVVEIITSNGEDITQDFTEFKTYSKTINNVEVGFKMFKFSTTLPMNVDLNIKIRYTI